MKQSHYTTPRTLNDAEFQCWGEAFHHEPNQQQDRQADQLVLWASIVAMITLLSLAIIGWLS